MSRRGVRIIASAVAAVLAFLLVFAFVAEIVIATRADAAQTVSSLNDKLSDLDAQKKKIQQEIDEIESQKQSTMTKKEALDKQIDITQQEVDTINELIQALDVQIKTCGEELAAAQAKEAEEYEQFLKRVRVMEEEGSASMLGIILSADSFSDMLTRTEVISSIVEGDKKLMQELAEMREGIEKKKEELDSARSQQETAKSQLVSKQTSLTRQYNEANDLIKSLDSEVSSYEAAFEEAERAQEQVKAELKSLLASQSGTQTKYVGGELHWPSDATRITSPYGMRNDPITKRRSMHTGIDIGAKRGTNVYSANAGTVIIAGWSSRGYGNYVVVDHGGGRSTLYAHMSKILVSKGQKVTRGQVVGLVGSTGYSTGPHLHFEVLINGDHTNPMAYFK